ncbi:hypothetical protein EN866_35100 [Mesorhizobium sp. M2D.F.Ca.ET.223.01.1.1]|uniref:hypothetical protein n=1 Tax=Mesorhizobium sp. M2D.F.Ca.ET.223.01.1.1 TaxID=2563940 RepID=UPI001092BAD8|nr:hypothetical protein [Mesorhizobium sp. M2D.F.Ca.ET.223.01.1.1]TGR81843.1 hypothetical protein EN866_35100 [Mesorhizobium sp. M2D.F.Ca.ET.223.01.1.1]TGT68827.1 hypothetical protein EN802_26425 [bacterium M00.F.Ca.ET.159.01.1.1]TGT80676.1 hypothetical protein EN800_25765 [bacterium M00.F.Ca.ET.157.01.1.1]
MGATYGNISVKGPTREALVTWLRSRNIDAFVTAAEPSGWTTFSDQHTDGLDPGWIEPLLQSLTRDLACIGIAITVYDEEQLRLWVAKDGVVQSRYNSCPGVEMSDPDDMDMRPRLDDAAALLATIGKSAASDDLLQILGMDGAKEYMAPLDLHEELVTYLELPENSVGLGHRYTLKDKVDLLEEGLVRTVES